MPKNNVLKVLFPSFVLFMFLFNIVWTTPISILSKVLSISDYFILTHFFVIISAVISVIYGIILSLSLRKIKLYQIITGVVYGIVLLATLYRFILPYSYGYFEESINLAPTLSLLGFSKWYYALDFILIIISIYSSYKSVKAKILFLPLVLLFFYSYENIYTICTLDVKKGDVSSSSVDIVFSTNHKNLLLYIIDSVGAIDIDHMINNVWSKEEGKLLNDFTFYDNVVTFTTGRTMVSLPSIIGGYQFTPQHHISYILKNNISSSHPEAKNFHFLSPTKNESEFFFSDKAFSHLYNTLGGQVDIKYNYIHQADLTAVEKNTKYNKEINSPILGVSLYSIMPYFLRFILTANNGAYWNDKLFFLYKWIILDKTFNVLYKETEKPILNVIHNWGAHDPLYPWVPELSYMDNLSLALQFSLRSLNGIISNLQEKEIYDSTKIILTSDHGNPPYQAQEPKHAGYEQLKKDKYAYIGGYVLHPVLLIKNFNETNTRLTYDSRTLTSADIHGSLVAAFTNIPEIQDVTRGKEIKKEWNIPFSHRSILIYFMDKEKASVYIKNEYNLHKKMDISNGQLSYIKYRNRTNYEILSHPLDTIEELPPYQLLKE
ncbi:MAG: hypothetical protein ACRC9L_01110 [Brevinema sp.]